VPDRLLRLLGSPYLDADGQRRDLPNNVPGFLAAWLAVHDDWAERDAIALVFWPDMAQAQALHNLRVNLHRLKAWLDAHGAGGALRSEKRRVRLDLASDVTAFRAAVGGACWAEALDWHRGELLASASLPGLPGVDEWLHAQRQALAATWREAALRQAEHWQAAGQWVEAAALLQRQLENDLLAEDLLQALLRLAPRAGCVAPALSLHERFVARLAGELGQAPLPETAALAAALRDTAELAPAPSRPAATQAAPIGPVRRSLPARLTEPDLVGRERELQALRMATAQPGVVVIRGEPGVGKTRLAATVQPRAVWWSCRAPEAVAGPPLAPVADYLDDAQEALRERPMVRRHASMLSRLVPGLAPSAGVQEPLQADDDHLRRALVDVFLDLGRPIVVDDLPWADAETLALLQALEAHGRLVLLATARTGTMPAAMQRWLDALGAASRANTVVDLWPLSEAAMAQWLARLSEQSHGAPRFARWLHRHSAGNPLRALEALRALFAQGRLTADAEGWHHALDGLAAAGYDELSLSSQVAELVRLRIETLAPATQRALRVCAIAGDARSLEPLAQVSGLSPLALGEALGEAQRACVLEGRRFAHELLRQAVLDGMPEALVAATHGAWLRHARDRLEPHARAHHAWAAGDTNEAVSAVVEAAEVDMRRGLHAASVALLADALDRLPDDDPQRAILHASRAHLWLRQGRLEEADSEALHALAELPGPAARALALTVQADVALQQGRLDAVAALTDAALEASPDHAGAVMVRVRWVHAEGDFAAGVAFLRARLAQLRTRSPGPELVEVLTSLASFIDQTGRYDEALPLHREAVAMAQRLKAPYLQVEAAVNLLWCLPEVGLHDEAIAHGERALALGHFDATWTLMNNLAYLYLERGRLDDASRHYQSLVSCADPALSCAAQAKMLQIHAQRGHSAQVEDTARALLQRLPKLQHPHARAIGVLSLLTHGPSHCRRQALDWVPAVPVDTSLQARLDAAVAAARAAA
jgi:DNA-binding SARP family transcriptional activator